MKKKVVLITGCNGGLGEALVENISKKSNFLVIATARQPSVVELEKKFKDNPNVEVYELDLLKPRTFPAIIKNITKNHGFIEVLINNAAITYRAVVEHVSDHDEKLQFQTNYFAPRELIRCVLPSMKKHRRGKIINVSSVSGMMAMPTMSSYSASKWSLEGMSESLWYELKPFGISVSLIQIGFVNSNSFKKTIMPTLAKKASSKIYKEYYSSMSSFISKVMNNTLFTPEKIAATIFKEAIDKKKPHLRIAGTWDATFFYLFRRFIPRGFYHWFLYMSLPSNFKRSIKKLLDPSSWTSE